MCFRAKCWSGFTDFRGPKVPPQRCEFDMKHVVLYVGHMYKPFCQNMAHSGHFNGKCAKMQCNVQF